MNRSPNLLRIVLPLAALTALGGGCIEDSPREVDPAEAVDAADGPDVDRSIDAAPAGDARMPDMPPPDARVGPEPGGPCVDPVWLTDSAGRPAYAVRCADGSVELVGGGACTPIIDGPACDPELIGDCDVDADCAAQPFGRCVIGTVIGEPGCLCRYGCQTDDECSPGTHCVCAGAYDGSSRCVPGDCGAPPECARASCALLTNRDECGAAPATACRRDVDTCRSAADCVGRDDVDGEYCLPGPGRLRCRWPDPFPEPEPYACP